MSTVAKLSKVFILLNDGCHHWYLMIIDIVNCSITYLDFVSCKDKDSCNHWLSQIKDMVIFMEKMLHMDCFYEGAVHDVPKIGDYDVEIPNGVPHQSKGSLDCGLWVCEWMRKYRGGDTYKIEVVEDFDADGYVEGSP